MFNFGGQVNRNSLGLRQGWLRVYFNLCAIKQISQTCLSDWAIKKENKKLLLLSPTEEPIKDKTKIAAKVRPVAHIPGLPSEHPKKLRRKPSMKPKRHWLVWGQHQLSPKTKAYCIPLSIKQQPLSPCLFAQKAWHINMSYELLVWPKCPLLRSDAFWIRSLFCSSAVSGFQPFTPIQPIALPFPPREHG